VRFALLLVLVACSSKKADAPPSPLPTPPVVADAAIVTAPSTPLEIRVDKRVELVSIVFRLAGSPEYNRSKTPYAQGVDKSFAAFKNHPAVAAAAELRKKHGISHDAVMILAVHLDDELQPVDVAELPSIDPRFTGVDIAPFAEKLRDFAKVAPFAKFYEMAAKVYDPAVAKLRETIGGEDIIGFFDGFFGKRPNGKYTAGPAMLAGSHNFGVRHGEHFYQLLGDNATLDVIVHEMAHSYINPLFGRHAKALEPAGTALFPLFADAMQRQSYANWQTMFNESGVRALVVTFMRDRKGDRAAAAQARNEMRSSFLWINELVEVFRKYPRGSDADAYMPNVVAFFDGLVKQYNGKPPPMPFMGPFDAIYRNDRALVLPKSGAVADYAKGLPFLKGVPIVDEASSIEATKGKGVVAYGTPENNAAVAQAAAWALWKITPDGIELGAKKFAGKDLVLIATWFRRDDTTRGIAVYASANEANLVGINHGLRHGPNDWLVAKKTAAGYEVIEAGDWLFENGAWVPFYE
jgi:hypothetical protein